MLNFYDITVPGISMRGDLPAVRRRLLADFPRVVEVLAMTIPATVQVVYRGEDEIDAWVDALIDAMAIRRMSSGRAPSAENRARTRRGPRALRLVARAEAAKMTPCGDF